MKTLNQLLFNDGQKIALIDCDIEITYEKLNIVSDQLACYFIENNILPNDRIVIKMKKSWETIMAMIAVLKARACYVMVDPTSPQFKQDEIIHHCQAKLVLSELPLSFPKVLKPLPLVTLKDLSYLYFTSGSSGVPKAACFDHERAYNFLQWAQNYFNIAENDRVACVSPLTFDVCLLDIFLTFKAQATLVLVPDKIKLFKKNLKDYLIEKKITIIQTVPTLWDEIHDIKLPSLKKIIFTGQAITRMQFDHLKIEAPQKYPDCRFYNLYGQTEANSYLCYNFTLEEYPIPIAHLPLPDFVEIKNETLWIKNHSLMKNYWGQDAIFEYDTGDLVKIENNKLYLRGRSDNRIKIKGYRIYLEEIELVLNQCVSNSCVFYDDVLTAVIENKNPGFSLEHIQLHCQQHLAPYFMPQKIIVVDEIDKNSNGKIDRKKIIQTFSKQQNQSNV